MSSPDHASNPNGLPVERFDLDDGKYSLIKSGFEVTALRHGQPWPVMSASLAHSGFHLALAQELSRLTQRVKDLETLLPAGQNRHGEWLPPEAGHPFARPSCHSGQ